MNNNILGHLQVLLLVAVFSLCAYSYHPRFFDISTGQISNHSIVFVVEILILILVLINIWKDEIFDLSMTFFVCLFLIGLLSFGLQTFDYNSSFSECTNMMPAFLGLHIGANINIGEKKLFLSLRCYVLCSILIGLVCIFQYLGTFVIADQYLVAGKNAFGTTLAIAGVISLYLLIYKQSPKSLKVLDAASVLIIFIELLTIRARLASLGFFLVCSILFLRSGLKMRFSFVVTIFLVGALLALVGFDSFSDFIYNSFFQNKEADFTSARSDLNLRALEVIYNSPFWGNVDGNHFVDERYQVHNFLLNKLSHYGVFFSIPWLFLYFEILVYCIKQWIKSNHESLLVLGCSVMFVLFWESLGEYTYPFGPGTITFLPFLVLGYSIMQKKRLNLIP